MNNWYTFKISTSTLERKENMNKPRGLHGLYKMARKIFVFEGSYGCYDMKSAEVYDVVKNSWKNIPDMTPVG